MKPRPTRLAHVWTPAGIETVPIEGDWPLEIVMGEWIYRAPEAFNGGVFIDVGRRTGIEFVEYKCRRRVTCADADVIAIDQRDLEARDHGTAGSQ